MLFYVVWEADASKTTNMSVSTSAACAETPGSSVNAQPMRNTGRPWISRSPVGSPTSGHETGSRDRPWLARHCTAPSCPTVVAFDAVNPGSWPDRARQASSTATKAATCQARRRGAALSGTQLQSAKAGVRRSASPATSVPVTPASSQRPQCNCGRCPAFRGSIRIRRVNDHPWLGWASVPFQGWTPRATDNGARGVNVVLSCLSRGSVRCAPVTCRRSGHPTLHLPERPRRSSRDPAE